MANRTTSETVTVRPPDPLQKKIERLCRFLEIEETDAELVVKVVDPKGRKVVLSTGSRPLKIEATTVLIPRPVGASVTTGATATAEAPPKVQPVRPA